ncbi:cytochrome P450 4d1-like [Contarinia nasturtii]|uniref:cytochrome P450 4d1-like n=1 Tax=Contarinia nasturtii TaxID=265458 RepID=UPI0012D47C02|nr:cytochrome P450 4d1-like [Contarinia nasturtii]
MLVFLVVFLTLSLIYFLRFHYTLIHAFRLSWKINGPTALPLIGNGFMFWTDSSAEIFGIFLKILKAHGEYFRIWFGPELNVVISNPKDIEILLSSSRHIDKSTMYNFLKPWLNEGLLLSKGKKWYDRRKAITPAFHFNILEKFVEVFDRLGNTVVDKLKTYEVTDDVELYPIAVLYALDVMCETAMGVSVDALSKPNSEYVQAVKDIAYVVHTRMHDFTLRFDSLFKHSKMAKTHEGALHVLHGFTDDVIRKRRQELLEYKMSDNENGDQKDGEYEVLGIRKKEAFLDLLLHSTIEGKPLTDLEIREEVDTFMFEGHDTTTSGITFCLYNIAKHPEVQRKCFDEIATVFGSDTKEPTTISKLNQLSYLELVIKETLRLFPSVPFIGRIAMQDIELTQNRIIPTGANVLVPIYTIQRNEKYFEDADAFKPERFLAERTAEKQSSFIYVPFSAGPRNCIGQKFAMYEIKSIVSKILRNFELTLTEESSAFPTLTAELILRPENSIKFQLKPRVY